MRKPQLKVIHNLIDTQKNSFWAYLWYNHIKCCNCFSVIIQASIKGLNFFWIVVYYYRLVVDLLSQVTVMT